MQEKRKRGSGSKENVGRPSTGKKAYPVMCLPCHVTKVRDYAKELYFKDKENETI